MIGFNDLHSMGEKQMYHQDVEDLFHVVWTGMTRQPINQAQGKRSEEGCKNHKNKNMPDVLDTIIYIDKGVVRFGQTMEKQTWQCVGCR